MNGVPLSVSDTAISSTDAQRWLLFAAVVSIPFTSFGGVPQLGELQGSLSVHILLVLLVLSIIDGRKIFYGNAGTATVIGACLIVVVLSAFANAGQISGAEFKSRSGFGKLLTSTFVLIFGCLVLAQLPRLFGSFGDLTRLFVSPLLISVWIVAIAAIPEILSWSTSWGGELYGYTTGILVSTGQFGEVWREPGRLASLAFEAPDLAYYVAFCAPWVMCSYRTRKLEGSPLWGIRLTIILLFLLEGLAGSRTGYLMLGGWCLTEVLCSYLIGRMAFNPLLFVVAPAAVGVILVALFTIDPDGLATAIDSFGTAAYDERNISNISRSATASAQLCLFLQNRWFGVGLGQYAFQSLSCLPDWSLASFEIKAWFFSPEGGFPPTFSAIGRIAAELGLIGILAFFGILSTSIFFFVRALASTPAPGNRRTYLIATIGSLVILALGAFSSDFIRRPDTWILFAVLSSYRDITERP